MRRVTPIEPERVAGGASVEGHSRGRERKVGIERTAFLALLALLTFLVVMATMFALGVALLVTMTVLIAIRDETSLQETLMRVLNMMTLLRIPS